MQSSNNSDGLSIINFGIGSPNAALIMDLLSAKNPKGVLFLGKCGGLKEASEIGNFILPIAAIRGKELLMIIFHQKYQHCLHLSSISLFLKKSKNQEKITELG